MSKYEARMTDAVLAPYLNPPLDCDGCPSVRVFRQESPLPNFHPQAAAFDACLQAFATDHDWMFFIDIDEFIAFPSGQSLPGGLHTMRKPATCLIWRTMLPDAEYINPTAKRPADSLLTQLAHMSYDDSHVGKLGIFTGRSMGAIDGCRFDRGKQSKPSRVSGMQVLFSHNCYAGSTHPTNKARSFSGSISDHCHCTVQDSDSDPIVLYHYFLRTCHEWVNDLIPKRLEWKQRMGIRIGEDQRGKPRRCQELASVDEAIPAPFLERFANSLNERVSKHPLWGHPVDFFHDYLPERPPKGLGKKPSMGLGLARRILELKKKIPNLKKNRPLTSPLKTKHY